MMLQTSRTAETTTALLVAAVGAAIAVSIVGLGAALSGCGTDPGGGGSGGDPDFDAQSPPEGESALTAWIDQQFYKQWTCEGAIHDAREPSPHGRNRICSNDTLSLAQASPWPVGGAAVKELYDDGDNLTGYAVYKKVADGTDGSNWYWYETNAGSVVADGRGSTGAPLTICVSCHSHAEDFVFTRPGAGGCGGG